MAEKRMFAKSIIDSDEFLEMPVSSQNLYFHLGMRADDDGFINKPKTIMRMLGCKDDDIKILFAKKFIIPFDSGVVVIKHWRINNYIRKDTYKTTNYKEELAMLELDENESYRIRSDSVTIPSQVRNETVTQIRIEENSKDKNSNNRASNRFVPPTIEEVKAEILTKGYHIDAERFIDYYQSVGWMVGKCKMKNWRSALANWERRNKAESTKQIDYDPQTINPVYDDTNNPTVDLDEVRELMKGRL